MSVVTGTARRVQRVPDQWPIVHLETDVPKVSGLVVDGLVRHPRTLSLAALGAMGASEHVVDLHCVWGWSKPRGRWTGVPVEAVLDLATPDCDGTAHVMVSSASDTYSSCLPLTDAARGLLAWALDGAALTPEQGGPLRFVGPSDHWGYKGVKWATRLTVLDHFVAGFWESRLEDPIGRIPDGVELP